MDWVGFSRVTGDQAWNRTMKYTIFPEDRLVVVKFEGCVTIDKIAAYASALLADPGFHRTFREVVDLTDVVDFRIEAKEAIALADRIDPFARSTQRAFVVGSGAQYHVARMHQLLRGDGTKIGIFTSPEEAKRWMLNGEPANPPGSIAEKRMSARSGK